MARKTLTNYKRSYAKYSRGRNKEYKKGLLLGIGATTNNQQVHKWIETERKRTK